MTVNKKGMMVEIKQEGGGYLIPMDVDPDKPHVLRVKKAMFMQIMEMAKNAKWIAYLNSKNENIPNMGRGILKTLD